RHAATHRQEHEGDQRTQEPHVLEPARKLAHRQEHEAPGRDAKQHAENQKGPLNLHAHSSPFHENLSRPYVTPGWLPTSVSLWVLLRAIIFDTSDSGSSASPNRRA